MSKSEYPSLDEDEDEQILKLMSEAKVNSDMKQEAGNLFNRQSVKRFEKESEQEFNHIMEQAKSSMPIIKNAVKSSSFKSRMDVKMSTSKI